MCYIANVCLSCAGAVCGSETFANFVKEVAIGMLRDTISLLSHDVARFPLLRSAFLLELGRSRVITLFSCS